MTVYYVSSVDGSDASDGLTWANAKATVAGAIAVATASGDIIYVDSAHSFTPGAAITWNAVTANQVLAIISASRASGEPPTAWAAGAAENVGAANAVFGIGSIGGQRLRIFGMTINGGTGNSAGAHISIAVAGETDTIISVDLQGCTLNVNSTNAAARLQFGPSADTTKLTTTSNVVNCAVGIKNVATGAVMLFRDCRVRITGLTMSYIGGSKPASLCDFQTNLTSDVTIADSDLSAYEKSGGFYFDITNMAGPLRLINCKTSATPGLYTGSFLGNVANITAVLVDPGDTHNTFAYYNRLGQITQNTSNFANSGAQFDGAGISWEIVTTAACSEAEPFVTPWIHRWLDTTGSQDIHLQLLRASATDFTNREVWAEFECLENASFPIGTITSTRNAQPFDGTPVDLTNSAKTWTEIVANDNEMECRVTRTVAEKCTARARLMVGVASITAGNMYLDPSIWIGT
jgi:hypothetical protein